MGNLVFQATLGGQVNLVGPNTASTFNLNVPAVAGTLVTTGDTGTVTNTMLAGSIANAKLTNSSVTVGSTSIALGATATTVAGLTSLATNTLTSAAATNLTIQSAGTTAVTIDTSQNVNLAGKISFSYNTNYYNQDNQISNYASTNYLYVSGNGTSTGGLYLQGGGNQKQNIILDGISTGGNIAFTTNGSERMRIDSGGRLLLNQTSNNGTYLMQMIQQSSTSGAMLIQIATNGNNGVSFLNAGGAAQVGTIVVNSGSTAYNTSSDYRLKENIAPMTGALAKVAQLKPVTYKWKADGSDGQGFVAHELAEIVPDCVSGEKDAVDENGKPVYQGIDVSFLVATLTAAIQEQQALITAQAETINALTARVVALEAK